MNTIKVAAWLVVLSGATATAAVLGRTAEGQAVSVTRVQPTPTIVGGGGRLGIAIRDVEEEDAKTARLAGASGAVVDSVSEGSAAEKAGFRKGDIIAEFDGERVRSARQLTRLVQETADGRKVPTVVVRDGQRVTLTVEPRQGSGIVESLHDLGEWGRNFRFELPARPATPPAVTPRARAVPPSIRGMDDLLSRGAGRLGLTVDTLSPQLAEYFGTRQGVLVTSVRDDSVASKAGIKAGDVITSVNGSEIDDPSELRRRLQSLAGGAEVTIGLVRDKKAQTLKVKLEESGRRRVYRSIL